MTTLLLILISTFIFLPYIIFNTKKKVSRIKSENTVQLYVAEAGPTKYFFRKKTDMMSLVDVDSESISMNPDLQYFVVENNCMEYKGVYDGDIVGVKMFDEKDKDSLLCKPGDMLLIFLDDEHFRGYKIRELGYATESNTEYYTYHYKNGVKTHSSRPHSIDSIKGVVMEIHQASAYAIEAHH